MPDKKSTENDPLKNWPKIILLATNSSSNTVGRTEDPTKSLIG